MGNCGSIGDMLRSNKSRAKRSTRVKRSANGETKDGSGTMNSIEMKLEYTQDELSAMFHPSATEKIKGLFDSHKNLEGKVSKEAILDKLKWAHKVERSKGVKLGVVRLDYVYTPAPGDIDHPESFAYPVVNRAVPGLTFKICQLAGEPNGLELKADFDLKVRSEIIEVIEELDKEGVTGITGDCGFMMWLQNLARQHTKIPIFMSSLAHLPAITATFGPQSKIMIMTANGKTLKPMLQLIRKECSVEMGNKRYIIVGCEDVPGFKAVAHGDKVDVVKVTPGMVKMAKEVVANHEKLGTHIGAILLECTELPPYADALRAATGTEWQDLSPVKIAVEKIKRITAHYGSALDEEDIADLARNEESGETNLEKAARLAKMEAAQTSADETAALEGEKSAILGGKGRRLPRPKLGVIQLETFIIETIGDIDHPESHPSNYDVVYNSVPGLTLKTCMDGPERMSGELKYQLKKAVQFLDKEIGVSAITGNCGFMLKLQDLVQTFTKKPVFMSPLIQVGSIKCSYGKYQKIALLTANAEQLKNMRPVLESLCGTVAPSEFLHHFATIDLGDIPYLDGALKGEHQTQQHKTEVEAHMVTRFKKPPKPRISQL